MLRTWIKTIAVCHINVDQMSRKFRNLERIADQISTIASREQSEMASLFTTFIFLDDRRVACLNDCTSQLRGCQNRFVHSTDRLPILKVDSANSRTQQFLTKKGTPRITSSRIRVVLAQCLPGQYVNILCLIIFISLKYIFYSI